MIKNPPNKVHFMPYPRTSGFAWSRRGHMVTYSYDKYDFSNLKKSEESVKNNRHVNSKEIPAQNFKWDNLFDRYFMRSK